ncbi:MAG: ABC transporter [Betaproteobacteria bacterium RIFCSPLOWO2_02_64_14]|nr:MAG: ABC transporter [Betaproteobacteria bacterium RIFCSPLOWO2_02_64_14]
MYFDWQLWRMTAGLRWRIALGVVLGLAALVAGIARFVFLGSLLARVFEGAAMEELLAPAIGTALAIVLRAALEQTRIMLAHRTAARVQEDLRARLYDKIVALGPGWFSGSRTGGVMLTMVDGVEQLQSFFGQYLPQLFVSACAPFAIFAFMAWWDLPVAGVMLAAALFGLTLPALVHRQNRESAVARQASFKAFGEEFLDAMQGLATLKAFGQGQAYARMLAGKARTLSADTMWVLVASVMARGITDVGIAVGAAAALALGVYRVTGGAMSLEALLIVLMAGTEIFRPLRDLRTVLHQGMVGQSAAGGMLKLLNAEETAPAGGSGTIAADKGQPGIAFEGVHFAYPGVRNAALEGLSFSLAPGERVGVVGPSGAGKSSIVRLLLRLYDPQKGTVRMGERDLRALDPDYVRRQIAVVAQDTYLFHGTVEYNLRLGRPQASEREIEAAARAANAHDFILALPDGYRTLIGERGTRLSGGQRQRLAIARALLLDAPILILDEALSSVDAENEAVIQEALERLMQGRTTLILAHRLSSVIAADRILVLDHGRVVESGRHEALIARDGPYRRLMGAQASGADDDTAVMDALDARDERGGAVSGGETAVVRSDESPVKIRDIDVDAASVGWRQTIGSLLRFIRPWRRQLAVTTACGVGRVAAFIAVGVLGALAIAAIKTGASAGTTVIVLLIVAPLVGLLHLTESWLAHDMAYRLLAEMRINLFAKLEALAPAYLLERRSGDLVALATQDIETVEYFFAHTVAPAFVAVLVPVVVLAWLGVSAWPLAAVLLPFLAYAGLAPVLKRGSVDAMASQARAALGQLAAHVTETIQGLPELMAFRAAERRREEFMRLTRQYQALRLILLRDLTRQSERLELAAGLGGLAIAVIGANLVASGALAPTTLPLLILIAVAAFVPVSEIAQVSRQLADTIASTRRLHVVEAQRVAIVDGTNEGPALDQGIAVAFERVGFTYPGREHAALSDVSFEVAMGSTVALVGSSGAGKTSIANLLLRFWDPDKGVVRLGGIDLRELTLDGLRSRIALVAQDTYLFNDTLEANIRMARPEASREVLTLAIEQAALSEFVATLPDGLQTRVGERGVQLSGGQRQRIAIARAFLKDAPILVLDEATSHLDAISEEQVHSALESLMAHRTTILIAHRLSTIRAADRILVLDHGSVTESGTHAQLLARRGFYAHLIERQMTSVRERVAV